MSEITQTIEVLPTDRRGRVIVSKERRAALLEEFDRRGMTAAQFAQWSGINYQTFWGWLRRRPKASGSPVPAHPDRQWVEAVVQDAGPLNGNDVVVVELPGNARVVLRSGTGATVLAALLRELEYTGGRGSC